MLDELTMKDERLVIPELEGQMRRDILQIAHEGHLGTVKTKAVLRGAEIVYIVLCNLMSDNSLNIM